MKITTTREKQQKDGKQSKPMKNFNFAQKLILVTILLLCASLLFLYWYKHTYTLDVPNDEEVNSTALDGKLLIAAMGSPFKDSIAARVLKHYNASRVAVDVIKVKGLANTDAAHFDAILMLHSWEAGAPTEIVQAFMDKSPESEKKIVMLTTSWNGLEQMENIDAITGASIMVDVSVFTDQIIKRLDRLLKNKK
ncbi:hypothetical protein ESY88_04890 [Subsaximicrobium wynnwilliamsii]|nr:hypothetical protein ESY88_04890 [Subsaximicrobium wynnwilliamsii]